MKNIEEHILVLTTHNEDGKWTQDGCFANDRYAIYSASMTRQQAIDIMADALIKFKYLNTASADDIEECERDAGVCLNALLNRGSDEER